MIDCTSALDFMPQKMILRNRDNQRFRGRTRGWRPGARRTTWCSTTKTKHKCPCGGPHSICLCGDFPLALPPPVLKSSREEMCCSRSQYMPVLDYAPRGSWKNWLPVGHSTKGGWGTVERGGYSEKIWVFMACWVLILCPHWTKGLTCMFRDNYQNLCGFNIIYVQKMKLMFREITYSKITEFINGTRMKIHQVQPQINLTRFKFLNFNTSPSY